MVHSDQSTNASSEAEDAISSTIEEEGQRSVFNSRPPTAKKSASGAISILQVNPNVMTEPEGWKERLRDLADKLLRFGTIVLSYDF